MLSVKKQFLKKQQTVQFIKEKIDESSAIIFYNFSHAENEEIFSLKKKLREVDSEWIVCKNTLFKKSLGHNDLKIKENNAFIFCRGDQYKPLKVLKNFDFREELEDRIQGGIYDGNLVAGDILTKWAGLKSREFLINEFCHLLLFNINKLTILLDEMKANKE